MQTLRCYRHRRHGVTLVVDLNSLYMTDFCYAAGVVRASERARMHEVSCSVQSVLFYDSGTRI